MPANTSHLSSSVVSITDYDLSFAFLTRTPGFLILTELPLFKQHFARNWPLFGPKSGFVMLGTSMILVGNAILANLNKAATSPKAIGMWAWRLVIGAGIIIVVMGAVNLFAVSPLLLPPPPSIRPLIPLTELHIPRHSHQPNSPASPLAWRRGIPQSRR